MDTSKHRELFINHRNGLASRNGYYTCLFMLRIIIGHTMKANNKSPNTHSVTAGNPLFISFPLFSFILEYKTY